jgi:hypothetical protein
MFGPGEYVPDPTEGIIDANDLPQPIIVPYDRNHDHSPCPRCGHLAYRHKSGQRTLHDLGDCPRMSISGMLVSLRHAVRASDGRARGMPHSPWKARSCSCEGLTPSQGPSQPPESGPSSG